MRKALTTLQRGKNVHAPSKRLFFEECLVTPGLEVPILGLQGCPETCFIVIAGCWFLSSSFEDLLRFPADVEIRHNDRFVSEIAFLLSFVKEYKRALLSKVFIGL